MIVPNSRRPNPQTVSVTQTTLTTDCIMYDFQVKSALEVNGTSGYTFNNMVYRMNITRAIGYWNIICVDTMAHKTKALIAFTLYHSSGAFTAPCASLNMPTLTMDAHPIVFIVTS
jgi:hypothetical protein